MSDTNTQIRMKRHPQGMVTPEDGLGFSSYIRSVASSI